jgi:hypothetical protein
MDVRTENGRVDVTLRPPAPLDAVERALRVSASAEVRQP